MLFRSGLGSTPFTIDPAHDESNETGRPILATKESRKLGRSALAEFFLRAYPQIVAPVSRPAVLAASKPPEAMSAGLETCTTAALESGATESAIYG